MNTLSCPAKVNLFLAITGKDSSGYHTLETVMARNYSLQDFIQIGKSTELSVECEGISREENIVTKAIRILENHAKKKFPYKIQIEKNIPAKSGLGGGSSNAAAVMLFINEHEGLDISHKTLMSLGAEVGMDVPFFISGCMVALCTHYGEEITPLPDLPKDLEIKIHLAGEMSTQAAYEEWDKRGEVSNKTSKKIQAALVKKDSNAIIRELHNDFQTIFPLPKLLENTFPKASFLTGSGGAFAVFHVKDTHK